MMSYPAAVWFQKFFRDNKTSLDQAIRYQQFLKEEYNRHNPTHVEIKEALSKMITLPLMRFKVFTDKELLKMKDELYDYMADNPSFLDTYIFTQLYDDLMEYDELEKEIIKRHLPSLNPEELTEQIKINIARDFYDEMEQEEIKRKCITFENGNISYHIDYVSDYTMNEILDENRDAFREAAKQFLENEYELDPKDFWQFEEQMDFEVIMAYAISDLIENGYILVEPEYAYPEDIRNNNYDALDIPFVLKGMNEEMKQNKGMKM